MEVVMGATADNAHPTQTRLLAAVCDGSNQQAWADFHRIYAPLIAHYLHRRGLTPADIEDATQEILMIAYNGLRERVYERERGRFRAWLYGVARRKAMEAVRNRRRPSRTQAPDDDPHLDLLSGAETPPGEADREVWEQEWRYALLAEALRAVRTRLNPKVYAAFVGFGIQQRPAEEVAGELGVSVSTVYVYKSRGLDAVRAWVEEYEADREEDTP